MDVPGSGDPPDDTEYLCWDVPVPLSVLDDGATADTLGEDGRAALEGAEVPPIDPAEWTIVTESPELVALIRELDEPEDLGAGDVRTHELLTVAWVDAANLDPSPAWVLGRYGTCALRTDSADHVPDGEALGEAGLTLDPANPPDPAAREVHLLVTEQACASGEAATGRVVLADLVEADDVVDLVIGVKELPGGANCPSNPPTPFVVELDAPLGDRAVRDAAVTPPRELTMPDSAPPN
jgi:hypothetical protein